MFAYYLRLADLAWFGQTGSDQGRDIIGTYPFDDQRTGAPLLHAWVEGAEWGPSTIHGNAKRGVGILNNELYIGRISSTS